VPALLTCFEGSCGATQGTTVAHFAAITPKDAEVGTLDVSRSAEVSFDGDDLVCSLVFSSAGPSCVTLPARFYAWISRYALFARHSTLRLGSAELFANVPRSVLDNRHIRCGLAWKVHLVMNGQDHVSCPMLFSTYISFSVRQDHTWRLMASH
jgi:hypothetical protein